jgi:TonB-dependent receptor
MPHHSAPRCRRRFTRQAPAWLLSLLVAWTGGFAAEAVLPHLRFDIPEGEAVVTLKRAAQDAGLEIVYSAVVVEGVRTRAIAGEFSPREAIARLIAGTPLAVFQDPESGALSIVRLTESEPRAPPAKEPSRPMKPRNLFTVIGSWLALALSPASGADGSAAAPAPSASISGRIQNIVTGQFLNNARVAVRGTDLVAFTDETGIYRLPRVAAGRVVLEAFYTGLDPQSASLEAAPGAVLVQDFELTNVARYGDKSAILKLDSFVVATSRETNAAAIAINEQRFAPNIKNVVAADALGDVMDGNVGEFMKFLPGITADYDNEDGSTIAYISIRGLPSSMAGINVDGAQMASTSTTFGDSRQFSFNSTSINNIARVEVTKVPTPADAADSLAGSVNLVSKSAFERTKAQLRYNLNLTGHSENLALHRLPHTTEERIFKILPGLNFDYTLPVSPRLGFVLTGMTSRRFTTQHRSTNAFNNAGTATGASIEKPFLQSYRMFDSPRVIARDSLGVKADWRVTPNGVLSAGVQWSHYESNRIATDFTVNAGTTGTSTPAGGTVFSYGPDFTVGATGRGALSGGAAASVHPDLTTNSGNLGYRYDNGQWRVVASASLSRASGGYMGTESGNFRQFAMANRVPVRVTFREINPVRPQVIEVYDNANRPVDFADMSNYVLNTANSTPRDTVDQFATFGADVRRRLGFLRFPAAIQIGAQQRTQTRDIRRQNINWTYNGINGDRSPVPFVSPVFRDQYNYYGFRGFPLVSPKLAWEAFQKNPALFSKTAAQLRAEELFRVTNSFDFEEQVRAGYILADLSLLKDRLKLLGGVRFEQTNVEGLGPQNEPAVFVRNADGTFARTASGQRIRKPGTGASGSLEELAFIYEERGARSRRTYDGTYPSLHATFNVTANFVARAAYARTYGRPNLSEIIPTTTIDEDDDDSTDPNAIPGNISLRNPALKPWTADNYDLSLEYYTDQGGLFSAGVFQKEIRDFFGAGVIVATTADTQRLGLDPRYAGWRITTKFNSGNARISGAEFNIRHSLAPLGAWGRHFSGFVNGTKLQLEGDRQADFSGFTPEALNWGFTYSRRPVQFMAKWNYRGKQRLGAQPAFGPEGYDYQDRRLSVDVNLEYQIRKDMFLYVNAQNLFNAPYVTMRYGSATPDYAKVNFTNHNGVGLTLGLKGTF